MLEADEDALAAALLELEPDVAFVDGQRWPSPAPPLVASISAASQGEIFIWNRRLSPSLQSTRLQSGQYQGPSSGVVIQFERSPLLEAELRSGRIAAGWDDADASMSNFVRAVCDVVESVTTADLETLTGKRFPYRIGTHARAWLLSSPSHRLRDRSVLSAYFRLRSSAHPKPTAG